MTGSADGSTALTQLATALAVDPSVSSDPLRLRAVLLDLAPHDEDGAELLVLAARLSAPVLIAHGEPARAVRVLIERAGLRAEVAEQLVRCWAAASGTATDAAQAEFRQLARMPNRTARGPAECLVWPDGTVTIIMLTFDGLLITHRGTPIRTGEADWHVLAGPAAPLSRGAALTQISPDQAVVVWSDHTGIWTSTIGSGQAAGAVWATEPKLLDQPEHGEPRYPVAALPVAGNEPDVFWTSDRHTLFVTTSRAAGTSRRRQVTSPCADGERMSVLVSAGASDHTAWLGCLTDRGRILIARWDLQAADHGGWHLVPAAAESLACLTIASLAGGTSLLAMSTGGTVFTSDASAAYAGQPDWRRLRLPADLPSMRGVRSLSASACGDVGWATVTSPAGLWLLRLQRYGESAEFTEKVEIQ